MISSQNMCSILVLVEGFRAPNANTNPRASMALWLVRMLLYFLHRFFVFHLTVLFTAVRDMTMSILKLMKMGKFFVHAIVLCNLLNLSPSEGTGHFPCQRLVK